MIETCDPYVFIKEQRFNENGKCIFWHYYRTTDEKEWIVEGECIGLGKCWEGAVGPKPTLDCPVAHGFTGCCDLKITDIN
jgi:hypothetical protein